MVGLEEEVGHFGGWLAVDALLLSSAIALKDPSPIFARTGLVRHH